MPLIVEAANHFELLSGNQSTLALTVYCALAGDNVSEKVPNAKACPRGPIEGMLVITVNEQPAPWFETVFREGPCRKLAGPGQSFFVVHPNCRLCDPRPA